MKTKKLFATLVAILATAAMAIGLVACGETTAPATTLTGVYNGDKNLYAYSNFLPTYNYFTFSTTTEQLKTYSDGTYELVVTTSTSSNISTGPDVPSDKYTANSQGYEVVTYIGTFTGKVEDGVNEMTLNVPTRVTRYKAGGGVFDSGNWTEFMSTKTIEHDAISGGSSAENPLTAEKFLEAYKTKFGTEAKEIIISLTGDQETNRHGISTFSTEQGFRQGSLRCFEGALRDDVGGGLGTMTCFNRVGLVAGAASEAVLVKVLREEWGFKGVNLTDSSKDASAYVHTEECVMGGTDMFNNDTDRTTELLTLCRQDGNILNAMKKINKHYFYAYARSNNINGIDENTEIVEWVPWWQPTLYAFIAVSAVLTAAALTMFILGQYVFGRKNKEEKNEN